MSSAQLLIFDNHRSRERIRDMGEVFTPDEYVQRMLALFDDTLWSDENVIFFEPSCGHGNIVLPILEKRIATFSKKYQRAKLDKPTVYAVANSLHTFWAIDICPLNVELTRRRVMDLVTRTLSLAEFDLWRPNATDFLAHVMCTLVWQIHENEALSALSDETNAKAAASQTRLGREWIRAHSHKPTGFGLDWCEFFRQSKTQNAAPLIFQRAIRLIDSTLDNGTPCGIDEFNFAKASIGLLAERRRPRRLQVGVA